MSDLDAIIQRGAVNNSNVQKARLANQVFKNMLDARPGLLSSSPGIAQKLAQSRMEALNWRGTTLNCVDTGNYVNFAANAQKFALWQSTDGVQGVVGTNTASSNEIDVITWVGFYVNYTIQAATFQEIAQLGTVTIQYGEQTRVNRVMRLERFTCNQIARTFNGNVAAAAEVNATPGFWGSGFLFDSWEPMVVIPGDSRPMLQIGGLTGTVAGSSPALTVQMHVRGIRIRL
jgi:hypothetical protein